MTRPTVAGGPRSDAASVVRELDALAQISDAGPGVTRVAYTERDAEARAWFAARCEAIGLRFEVDRFGNCFGWAPGCERRAAVLLGSHLDSVREAGMYDGALGVIAAFEVARAARHTDPDAPVAVVAFACEESVRFGIGAIGSRLLVGDLGREALDAQRDLGGQTLREVLAQSGLDPEATSSFDVNRLACFLEVHVDQGSALEDGSDVGIVEAIAGCVRTKITFTGEAAHSGAHARPRRRNALLGAARFVTAAEDVWTAIDKRGQIVAITIGWIENRPNAPNSVSGRTDLVLDLRAPEPDLLAATQAQLVELARGIAADARLGIEAEQLGFIEPVAMASPLVKRLSRLARSHRIGHRVLPSLAGHDSEILGTRVPTAMLFVANPAAVSHRPEEAIDAHSLANTLELLDAAVAELVNESVSLSAPTDGYR